MPLSYHKTPKHLQKLNTPTPLKQNLGITGYNNNNHHNKSSA